MRVNYDRLYAFHNKIMEREKNKGYKMKTLNIEVNDSVYEHILFFLQNLPKDMVKISKQIEPNQMVELSTKEKVEELFKTKNIEPFKDIQDPVAWQKSMRDEWE